jgi:APA family basic amino acid/polyamine antiporter
MVPSYNASTVEKFTDFILLATTTTLIAYVYGAAARLVQLARSFTRVALPRMAGELVVALLALAYAVWALYGAGYRSATWAVICVFAGIPIYAWLKGSTPEVDRAPAPPQPTHDVATVAPTDERLVLSGRR